MGFQGTRVSKARFSNRSPADISKALPRPGAALEHFDREAGATYSFDVRAKTMISYDNVQMAMEKVDFMTQRGLGGAMLWESSADKSGSESLIHNVSVRTVNLNESPTMC